MAVRPTKCEDPCNVTGSNCTWQREDWYDDEGTLESWDFFCTNCGRWRDWKKEEFDFDRSKTPAASTSSQG